MASKDTEEAVKEATEGPDVIEADSDGENSDNFEDASDAIRPRHFQGCGLGSWRRCYWRDFDLRETTRDLRETSYAHASYTPHDSGSLWYNELQWGRGGYFSLLQ